METLLENAEARVHLDARRPGVVLPDRLCADGHVRLDYGYRFTPPIPDLTLDDEGIHATLSFSRVPFRTFVPWSAVYLIADFEGHGAVWQEDIPPDVLASFGQAAPPASKPSLVACEAPADEGGGDEPPPPGKKPRPPWLKIVK